MRAMKADIQVPFVRPGELVLWGRLEWEDSYEKQSLEEQGIVLKAPRRKLSSHEGLYQEVLVLDPISGRKHDLTLYDSKYMRPQGWRVVR